MSRISVSFAVVLLFAVSADALTRAWTGKINERWSVAENWVPAGTPQSGDVVQFPSFATESFIITFYDLPQTTVLASVNLGSIYGVTGDRIRVRDTAYGVGPFEAEVQANHDKATFGGDFKTLDVNGYQINLFNGTIGTLVGTGSLTTAATAFTLTGTHPFTGEVRDGSATYAQPITLANASLPAATFRINRMLLGEGTIGPLVANGSVDPDGHITTGNLTFTSNFDVSPSEIGDYHVDITPNGNDALIVHGTVTIEDKPLTVTSPGFVSTGSSYTIIDNDGSDAVTGHFVQRPGGALTEGAAFTADGRRFRITYRGGTGNDVVLTAISETDDPLPYAAHHDIAYTSHGTMLDLRLPRASATPMPVIIAIDADDWSESNRLSDLAERQATRGYAVVTIDFRSTSTSTFPAQLDDVRAAIAWVRDHASQYNLDPLSIAVWGRGLAGGHLAALAGTNADVPGAPVQAAVIAQAATDLQTLLPQSCVNQLRILRLLGCDPSLCPSTAQNASPIAYATNDDAQFLILHGTGDCNAPRQQSESFADALRGANVSASLLEVDDFSDPRVQAAVDELFDRVLLGKARRGRAVRK